ncbi:hypothetical protein ACHAPT_002747 [Fusarium lateritium]
MGFSKSLLLAVVAFTCMTPTNSAKSNDDDKCLPIVDEIREHKVNFNSTKTVSFTPSLDLKWHLTVGLQDWREKGADWGHNHGDSVQHADIFLSIPNRIAGGKKANDTRVCFYHMDGVNATSNDEDSEGRSCGGILSDECQSALQSIRPPESLDAECPKPPMAVEKACRKPVRLFFKDPFTFNNTNCSVSTIPGVGLPGGYKTYPAYGLGLLSADRHVDEFDAYDLQVRQPIPMYVTMRFDDGTSRVTEELLCVAPDEVAKGSRKPEGEFPPSAKSESSATSRLDTKGAAVLVMSVWFVMGLLPV